MVISWALEVIHITLKMNVLNKDVFFLNINLIELEKVFMALGHEYEEYILCCKYCKLGLIPFGKEYFENEHQPRCGES